MSSEVRFTRAQRWDLVRISAAAVASTVFFTVPMFLVAPHPAATRIATRDGAVTARAESTPADNARSIALDSVAATSGITDGIGVSVVTSTEFAAATTP